MNTPGNRRCEWFLSSVCAFLLIYPTYICNCTCVTLTILCQSCVTRTTWTLFTRPSWPKTTCIGYGPVVTVTLGLAMLPGELLVKRGWHSIDPSIEAIVGVHVNNDQYMSLYPRDRQLPSLTPTVLIMTILRMYQWHRHHRWITPQPFRTLLRVGLLRPSMDVVISHRSVAVCVTTRWCVQQNRHRLWPTSRIGAGTSVVLCIHSSYWWYY